MLKRFIILPLFMAVLSLSAMAQFSLHTHSYRTIEKAQTSDSAVVKFNLIDYCKQHDILNHLDLGVNVGTTGFGLTLQLPIGDMARLRTGFDYMPRTNVPMTFDLMSYAGTEDDPSLSEDDKFEKLSSLMEGFTGVKLDREIDMHAHGTTIDFKLLVDVYPIRDNKHFYATAGFFWGSSKVGHIENTITEAPTLMGVIMYNRLYDFFMNNEFFFKPMYGDIYIDPEVGMTMKEKFRRYGRVGAHVGDFKSGAPFAAGTPYMLEPDENGTIYADMYVNHFKPYLGVGYTTNLSKDGRWSFSADLGGLFWGKPSIRTHERYIYDADGNLSYGVIPEGQEAKYTYGDYVNLATDVEKIKGKVGSYVKVAKAIHVYPVLNMRITYKLF